MWIDIPGLPGHQAHEDGHIRSPNGKILKSRIGERGGPYVNVGKTTRSVAKMILRAFTGRTGPVTFRNGDRTDVRLSNLCYGNPEHAKKGIRCSKNHLLAGDNVAFFGSNRICVACRDGVPAVRELPEVL